MNRHLFHTQGVTDLAALRSAAHRAGEPVVLHMHPYVEAFDGCEVPGSVWAHLKDAPADHELFNLEDR